MSGSLRSLARRAFASAAARPTAVAPKAPYAPMAIRAMATGPAASAVKISDELLEKLGSLTTQALIDGLWVMGWPTSHIMGARPLTEGQKKMVGRAVTIQFAGARPDIAADKPGGTESPEYEAFELVNGKEVIVMSSIGPWESVGGDIKFLRLHQNGVSVSNRNSNVTLDDVTNVNCRPPRSHPPPNSETETALDNSRHMAFWHYDFVADLHYLSSLPSPQYYRSAASLPMVLSATPACFASTASPCSPSPPPPGKARTCTSPGAATP